MWISPVPLMWVARVTCATLYVLGSWNATWCVLPCKGQQNSSKTLSSLCLCSSTSLAFSLLTQVTIFFSICFQVQFQSHIFLQFFSLFISRYTSSHNFFTVFLQINYFMVSRGWLKCPFTRVAATMSTARSYGLDAQSSNLQFMHQCRGQIMFSGHGAAMRSTCHTNDVCKKMKHLIGSN